MNHLAEESSLYLRQHAGNPVDWFPWGEEALALARASDRPIFLSIGYSACHWCHVMEHESFENETIAAYLNAHFVSIKVDREERPDLDQIYMTAHQILNRDGGGWPLSVFLTPDLTPFYAGTYFPPDDRYGTQRPSFPRLLAAITDAWRSQRDQLQAVGRQVAEHLHQIGEQAVPDSPLSLEMVTNALLAFKRSFDFTHGGFGHAPKFPHALELRLLLRIHARTGNREPLEMVNLALQKMARGGIYDQIGGGFHRYSVDSHWLVPHFEKMLYDNALLPPAYVEAFQVTGDPFYEQIARETLDYVLKEMTSEAGAFYSTLDADSEGEEGKFYVWTEKETAAILGEELAKLAAAVYGVTPSGNFEGHSILFRTRSDEEDAQRNGLSLDEFRVKLDQIRTTLYAARSKRIHPGRDEKILTAWNGLMIGAFAQAGAVFGEVRFIEAASRAADFVLTTLRDDQGRLLRTCGIGRPAKLTAYLEDYAYMTDSLVSLYEATFEPRWIQAAVALAEVMLQRFADDRRGGFFFTADDHEPLIARAKDLHDGSVPSGNAMAVTALTRLAALTGRRDFAHAAEKTLKVYHRLLSDSPMAAGQMLVALDQFHGPIDEVAVIGTKGEPETEQVLQAIRTKYSPNRVVAFHDPSTGSPPPEVALLADKPKRNEVAVYICRNFTCEAPIIGAAAIRQAFA